MQTVLAPSRLPYLSPMGVARPSHSGTMPQRAKEQSQQTPAPPYLRTSDPGSDTPSTGGPPLTETQAEGNNLPISPDRRHPGRSRKSGTAPAMPWMSSRMGTVPYHVPQCLQESFVFPGVHSMQQPQLDIATCDFRSPPHSPLDGASGGKDLRQESLLDFMG
ncbi:hypothetical protein E1301_Tti021153 [Triplophysa tibetana]|uniref:Uncharacterized protein n=1 Tax=Triplophysa tibetana TaxID=1572043 RepID=A0A5A9NQR2_9TELE|nr:hypothetical protein E1301_Tti021153 [Triplophysa tibetana]